MAKVEIEVSDHFATSLKMALVATGLKYRCSAMKKNVIIVSYAEPMELYKLDVKDLSYKSVESKSQPYLWTGCTSS